MLLSEWLTVFIIGLFVILTPGPNMAVVVRNSLAHSRRAGVYTAAGLALGNLVHISYCLVGIGVLISRSILLFNLIKWLGAAYLVYLGVRSLLSRAAHASDPEAVRPAFGSGSALRSGFLTDLLNPKATLFFLALFTQIVRPDTPVFAQVVYGVSVSLTEFLCFSLPALLIGHRAVIRRLERFQQGMERITGLVLIALGIRVAFSRSGT